MKILYVVHQFFPKFHTGSERLTLDTAKQIQRMGNYVTVLTYEPNEPLSSDTKNQNKKDEDFVKLDSHLMKKEYQVNTIPVIALKYTKHTLGFNIFDEKMEKHMGDIVKNFDVVHFTHPMFFCSALKVCKSLGVHTVLTTSDTWLMCPRSLVTSSKELCDGPEEGKKCMQDCYYGEEVLTRYQEAKYFYEHVDRVFASSYFAREIFRDNGWLRKMPVIHYSRDYANVKLTQHPKELVFGFMGSLIWHKGPDVLIKAFKKVDNQRIKLKIFGRGDERDPYLKNLHDLAKDDSRIEFCGTYDHKDLPNIMSELSILVVPSSYRDNFPLVMYEGQAHHKPLIGSKNGGIPEAIEEGVNGYLFDPGNSDQLAGIIRKISENPQEIKRLREGILPPPRIEGEAAEYENVYRELTQTETFEDSHQKKGEIGLQSKKILFLSHNLNLEGAPRWIYFLSAEIKNKGYDITIVSPQDGELKKLYQHEKIPVIIDSKYNDVDKINTSFFKQFDIVFLNTIINSIFVKLVQSQGIPAVLILHESEKDVYFSQGYKEEPIKNADKVIFSADATRKVYANLETNDNFTTIPTSIDIHSIESYKSSHSKEQVRKKHGYSANDFIVTVIGTVIERKGQMTFTEAAIKLLESGKKNLRFIIVGAIQTDYLNQIKEKIKQSGFDDKIKIIPVTDPHDYYFISDVFVCTSFVESYPNVIMEAMAFEIPIVSSDVFGIPEQITDGKQGVLIKPGDSEILAQKIQYLMDNPDFGKRIAKNAFDRITHEMTLENSINSYDLLIKEVLEKNLKQ